MRKLRRKQRNELLLALGAAAIFMLVEVTGLLRIAELKTLDLRFRLRGTVEPHPDIVMIDIADDAIDQFGRWPFGRHFHAMFLDAAASIGLEQIIYDIYFSKNIDPETDAMLGSIVNSTGNVFMPVKFSPKRDEAESDTSRDYLIRGSALGQKAPESDKGLFVSKVLLDPPIPEISRESKTLGFINTFHDVDGVSRRTPAVLKYRDMLFLQFTLRALASRYQVGLDKVEYIPGKKLIFKQARVGEETRDIHIPLDRKGNVLINWIGGWKDIKHYSFRDILVSFKLIHEGMEPLIPMDELTALGGKIAVVGLAERGSHDYYPIPFEKEYFLPGLQFNLLNTVMTESFIVQFGWFGNMLTVLFVCMLLGYVLYYIHPHLRAAAAGLYLTLFLVGSFWLFYFFDIWVPVVNAVLSAVLAFGASIFLRYINELKSKKKTKDTFQKYVTRDVMHQLLDDPESIKPGGEKKLVTIFFSDIRGFTSMSENHTAEEMVNRLNEYLDIMTKIIFSFKGTIDKFVGDEIMAYFGAPLNVERHANRAVETAVVMKRKMLELEKRWESEDKQVIRIGIGINTGEVVMGNVGSDEYMDFTLIGDNVNLGARLCSAAAANEVLLSESTYKLVSRHVEVLQARELMVKGKAKPVKVYSIMDYIADPEEERRKHRRKDAEIVMHYRPRGSEEEFKETIVNISGGGFRMEGTNELMKEQDLEIQFKLPNDIVVNDTIARVIDSGVNGDPKRITRARFTEIKEHDRDEIIKYVYSHETEGLDDKPQMAV